MKKLLIWLALWTSVGHAFGQKDSTLTYQQEVDYHLSQLPKGGCSTGILIDRVFPLSGLREMNKPGIPDNSSSSHFQQAFSELESARMVPDPELGDAFLNPTLVHFASENKIIPGVLCYRYNYLDPDLPVRGDLVADENEVLHLANGFSGSLYKTSDITFSALLHEESLQAGKQYILMPPMFITGGGRTESLTGFRYRFPEQAWNNVDLKTGSTISFPSVGEAKVELEITLSTGQVFNTHTVEAITSNDMHCDDPDWMRRDSRCDFWNSPEFQPTCGNSYKIEAEVPFTAENGQSLKGRGEVAYYYNDFAVDPCSSEIYTFKKPIIFVDGIDFYDIRKCAAIYGKFLQYLDPALSEHISFGKNLRHLGHDIAILNFPDGTRWKDYNDVLGWHMVTPPAVAEGKANEGIDGGCDYIERNAMTLVALIQKINGRTNDPIVLTGSSMGGQIARYALAYMEKNGIPHHCRLYISQDSPHLGASIPMGVQYFLKFYADKFSNNSAKVALERKVNNPASREMLLQYHGNSGNPDPLRAQYVANLTSNGVAGSDGWPKLGNIRKIALVNGSLNGTSNLDNQNGNTISESAKIWTHTIGLFSFINASSGQAFFAPAYGNQGEVFNATYIQWVKKWFFKVPVPTKAHYIVNSFNDGCSIDGAPGGFYNPARDVAEEASNWYTTFYSLKNRSSFISTKSALGFHWQNPSDIGNLCEDLSNRNLVCTGEIPFDAYYGENTNTEHVTISKDMALWVLNEINGNVSAQAVTQLPVTGPDVLCLNQTGSYSVNIPASCTGCQRYWMAENGLNLTSSPNATGATVQAQLNVGETALKLSVSGPNGCEFKAYKPIHFGKPDPISSTGYVNLPGVLGGFKTNLHSSIGTVFSVTTSGPGSCDQEASLQNGNTLYAQCSPDNIHSCSYTAIVKGTNQCGVVDRNFTVHCSAHQGGHQAAVDPSNPVVGIDPVVLVSVINEEGNMVQGPFEYELVDVKNRTVFKSTAESNPFSISLGSIEPAEYSVLVHTSDKVEPAQANFVFLKSVGSALSVSPNPAIKDVDTEAKVVILDNQTQDEVFDVIVEDFNGVRQQNFGVEGKTFSIDLSGMALGSYIVTVKGASSIFQEDIQLTMKGSSYLILNPNPVTDNVSLEIVNPYRPDLDFTVVITDKLGNIAREVSTRDTVIEIDVADLNPDLYYLQVFDGYQKLGKIFRKL